jgi:sugar lactone lactonase YvrE
MGDTMETTWRAPDVRMARRIAFALLILMLALALTAGTLIVGGQLIRIAGPDGPDALPAAALPPTACPLGNVLDSGDIATIAGTGAPGYSGDDGPAIAATVSTQYSGAVAVDASGAIYVSDTLNHVIRRIGWDGRISAFAGTGANGHTGDGGPALAATFEKPGGLAFDAAGDLYVADSGRIRKIDGRTGTISPVAGTGTVGSSGNGGPATDADISATQVSVGPDGRLYFDDANNFRTIDPDGTIRTFAGTGVAGYSGDGGPAIEATFGEVNGVAFGPDGVVYLGDAGGHRIRRVDAMGIVSTVAGTGTAGYSGDGGRALEATFSYPGFLVADPAGNLFAADAIANVVRRIGADGTVTTVAGTGVGGFSGDCGPGSTAKLAFPTSLAYHDGILYLVDANNDRVRMVVP